MISTEIKESSNHNPEKDNNLYIIGIGASAGGMEAIHLLFDNTPEDGVSYIIVQHLSPDHKSFMAELLEKHSKLKIFEAESDMYVKPNSVYLMPAGKNMTIKNRILNLSDSHAIQPNTAIDIFLDSLAEDQRDKSIAVILSGTGSDGTKGIGAIKKYGGRVIVQDPASAKFDGMPNSAIASGNADVILPPHLIPEEIITYLKRDLLENNFTDAISENDEEALLEILDLIQEHTPLDFTDYKRPTIIRKIVNRMAYNKIGTLADYINFLKSNPTEIETLSKEFLISVTKFFRDKDAFEILKKKVIPEIIRNKLLVDTLKVWVVGCATGEEAYSLAILITEHITERKKSLEVKIFASDIDKTALLHASKGIYPDSIANDVSEERLTKYFIKEDNKYKVRENIRKMIIFADHDIVKQPPYGKIDLISCRNLLIYINPLLQKKILSSLHFCLNLGGYLFLGPSESLGDLKKSFDEVDKKWKIYKSNEVVANLRNTSYSTPAFEKPWVNLAHSAVPAKSFNKNKLSEIIQELLLEESGYEAGIFIDGDFQIIQALGKYENFLLPKIFTFNLLELLPEALSLATSTSVQEATAGRKRYVLKHVRYEKNEVPLDVTILAQPINQESESEQSGILVLFGEEKTKENRNENVEVFNVEEHTRRHIENMKSELAETKQKLELAYDELIASNDNISSYNEELISSNEEMQSTNEELQSVNEELQTVNNEYQLKIKELAELNDDLNNYFKSTINGQLYVDKNLIVRKYTPSAIDQINLKESDVGRPLSDLSTNIKFATLMDDIRGVITGLSATEKEVQTNNGKWYQMMIIPYIREQDNRSDGAIITFNDITALKKVQDKLSRINADHDTFIYAVSHDLKGPLSNMSGLVSILQESTTPEDTDTKEVIDLIQKSVNNLREIIDELSDISKIEKEIDTLENVEIKPLFEAVKFSIRDMISVTKAKVHDDFAIPEIPFSKKNLRSILLNMLGNAIKYRSPDRTPEVTVKTEKSGEFILLTVKDNGLGLHPDRKDEVFSKFKRQHNHVDGSGVGLYLVKVIVTNAGGEVDVESELGKGSTFKVYFRIPPEEK